MTYRPQQIVEDVGHPQVSHLTYAANLLRSLPAQLTHAAHDPFAAQVLVYCLLLSDQGPVRIRQMHHLRQQNDPAIHHEAEKLAPAVGAMGPQARLPLLDLALPALRRLGGGQIGPFKQTVRTLIEADRQVSPFEFALYKILERQVTPLKQAARPPAVRYHALTPLMDDVAVLMSAIAQAGEKNAQSTQASLAAGVRQLTGNAPVPQTRSDERPELPAMNQALNRVASASPPVKRRVLESLAAAASADGVIHLEEAELLRAIAAALDCPIPPILHG